MWTVDSLATYGPSKGTLTLVTPVTYGLSKESEH